MCPTLANGRHGSKSFCLALILMLLISTSAFGYGLDGTKNSAAFTNQLGPSPAYANWSYEGGTVANPLADNLGISAFSEYNSTYNIKSSDGNILNWYNFTSINSGFYKYFSGATYWPDMSLDNGLTIEWKIKVNSLSPGSAGLYLGARDGVTDWYVYLNAADKVTAPGGLEYAVDINEWHTYRLTVLGKDAGVSKANFYVDDNLAFSEMTSGSISDKILWGGVSWDSAYPDADYDYIRIDATGAYAPATAVDYTLTVNTIGNGTVALNPDQATYQNNDVVQLTATADSGWAFSYWNGSLAGSSNPDTIVITANTSVTANFNLIGSGQTITVISPGSPIPSIVKGADTDTGDAADELADYLSRVSGRTVSVVSAPASTGTILHVGNDSFAQANAPEIANLYADGFIMKYVSSGGRDHIILAGNKDVASLWAVEQFLKVYAGVRWLFPDATYGEVVPSIPTIAIDSLLNETHEPDYIDRANMGMYYFNSTNRKLRLRSYSSNYRILGAHEIQFIFDAADFAAHPEWFAWFNGQRNHWAYGNGWQICLANQGTVDHAVAYCLAAFDNNPNLEVVPIGMNDGLGLCTDALSNNLRNSVSPPYTDSEMSWQWVNRVAAQVKLVYPDKWIEALAYNWSSDPPRFALESNVAITKTFVYDSAFDTAEEWLGPPANCQSVNLYSYTWGGAFVGFRHYPTAMRDFLRWGRDTLGSVGHVSECSGDWTFDGPKYYYTQAFQWDPDADPDAVMTEFCDASYGPASTEMKAFWDRLEEVWHRRGQVPYGQTNTEMLFYQWTRWQAQCYVQPNDEFREYTLSDVTFLDTRMANAISSAAGGNAGVQYRTARMQEAWEYYRTMLMSYLYLNDPPNIAVNSEVTKQAVTDLAREIASLEDDRYDYLGQMQSYPVINNRLTNSTGWFMPGWNTGFTIFSNEQTLLDEACTSVSDYIRSTSGIVSAIQYWQAIGSGDNLYEAAQTQIYMLRTPSLTDLLTNGNFEAGSLSSWTSNGSTGIAAGGAHVGTYSARLFSGACYGGTTISQTVSVSPLQRYRLSVWGKYISTPPADYAATEATIEFYNGGTLLLDEFPNRATFQSHSPADGWTQLTMAATAPAPATSAKITLKMKNSAEVRIDDIRFENIKGDITLPTVCGDAGTIYLESDLFPDCYVDSIDAAEFALSWSDRPCSGPDWCDGADVNKNGEVDLADFVWLHAQWADCTDPTNGNCGP